MESIDTPQTSVGCPFKPAPWWSAGIAYSAFFGDSRPLFVAFSRCTPSGSHEQKQGTYGLYIAFSHRGKKNKALGVIASHRKKWHQNMGSRALCTNKQWRTDALTLSSRVSCYGHKYTRVMYYRFFTHWTHYLSLSSQLSQKNTTR